MKAADRNNLMYEAIQEFQKCHDKYFPTKRSLNDSEWESFIHEMDAIADKYKDNPIKISVFVGKICMVYLDDIQEYDKKWRDYENATQMLPVPKENKTK